MEFARRFVVILCCIAAQSAAAQSAAAHPETGPALDKYKSQVDRLDRALQNETRRSAAFQERLTELKARLEMQAVEAEKRGDIARTEFARVDEKLVSVEGLLAQLHVETGRLSDMKDRLEDDLQSAKQHAAITEKHVDRFWLLIASAMVFLMQAGFKCLEVGMVRREHGDSTAMKNLLDWSVLSVVFFLFGFGLMHGRSSFGLFGTDLFAPTVEAMRDANPKFGLEFFLFQLAFAGTAATVVSGAMAERTGILPYISTTIFAGALV